MVYAADRFLRSFLGISSIRDPGILNNYNYEDPTYPLFHIKFAFNPPEAKHPDYVVNRLLSDLENEQSAIVPDSAIKYLYNVGEPERAVMLKKFNIALKSISEKTPWFFQTISGLDGLYKQAYPTDSQGDKGLQDVIIDIKTLDSIDYRITALKDLYRKAAYDRKFRRWVLPVNMRRFRMSIMVGEFRQLAITEDNYSINGKQALKALRDIDVFNASNIGGKLLGKVRDGDLSFVKRLQWWDEHFSCLVFDCQDCEFDMSTFPQGSLTHERVSAQTQNIKIKVGRVLETNTYSLLEYSLSDNLIENFLRQDQKEALTTRYTNLSGAFKPKVSSWKSYQNLEREKGDNRRVILDDGGFSQALGAGVNEAANFLGVGGVLGNGSNLGNAGGILGSLGSVADFAGDTASEIAQEALGMATEQIAKNVYGNELYRSIAGVGLGVLNGDLNQVVQNFTNPALAGALGLNIESSGKPVQPNLRDGIPSKLDLIAPNVQKSASDVQANLTGAGADPRFTSIGRPGQSLFNNPDPTIKLFDQKNIDLQASRVETEMPRNVEFSDVRKETKINPKKEELTGATKKTRFDESKIDLVSGGKKTDLTPNKETLTGAQPLKDLIPSNADLTGAQPLKDLIPDNADLNGAQPLKDLIPDNADLNGAQPLKDLIPDNADLNGAQPLKDLIPDNADLNGAQPLKDLIPDNADLNGAQPLKDLVPDNADLNGAQPLKDLVPDNAELMGAQPLNKLIPQTADLNGAKPLDSLVPKNAELTGANPLNDLRPQSADLNGAKPLDTLVSINAELNGAKPSNTLIPKNSDLTGSTPLNDLILDNVELIGSKPLNKIVPQSADLTGSEPIKDLVSNNADLTGSEPIKDLVFNTENLTGSQPLKDLVSSSADLTGAQPLKDLVSSSADLTGAQPLKDLVSSNSNLTGAQPIRDLVSNNADLNGAQPIRDLVSNNADLNGAQPLRDLASNNADLTGAQPLKGLVVNNAYLTGAKPLNDLVSENADLKGSDPLTELVPKNTDLRGSDAMKNFNQPAINLKGSKPLRKFDVTNNDLTGSGSTNDLNEDKINLEGANPLKEIFPKNVKLTGISPANKLSSTNIEFTKSRVLRDLPVSSEDLAESNKSTDLNETNANLVGSERISFRIENAQLTGNKPKDIQNESNIDLKGSNIQNITNLGNAELIGKSDSSSFINTGQVYTSNESSLGNVDLDKKQPSEYIFDSQMNLGILGSPKIDSKTKND